MSKVDKNDIIHFKEACDKTYATSRGADENGLVQQMVDGKPVYPKTRMEAVIMEEGKNLGTVMSDKQDKVLKFENMQASEWVDDTEYADFPYRCDIACEGVDESMYAEVVFNIEQATGGNYAPVCETKAGAVSIWSSVNAEITVPTIIITR